MRKNYLGLWLLLACAFGIFALLSSFDSLKIGSWEPKSSEIAQTVTGKDNASASARIAGRARANIRRDSATPVKLDTCPKTILFIGDSMLEGLSPRFAHYAKANGHKLYTVIWYSSTSEIWGGSGKLSSYISRLHPDYILICLGANELFVSDIAKKRDRYVKQIVKEIGDIPFLWIGPPNWKKDTGINDLIASNVPEGSFFLSDGMHFNRKKDGAHPTHESAALWADSIARWMPTHSNHPIRMTRPKDNTGRPEKIFVHQPNER